MGGACATSTSPRLDLYFLSSQASFMLFNISTSYLITENLFTSLKKLRKSWSFAPGVSVGRFEVLNFQSGFLKSYSTNSDVQKSLVPTCLASC